MRRPAAVREWAARRQVMEDLRAAGQDVSYARRDLDRYTASRPFAERIAIHHAERRVEAAVERNHGRAYER